MEGGYETLDPVFDSAAIILIKNIEKVQINNENPSFIAVVNNRRIKNVLIQGLIVAVDRMEEFTHYTIDDGTGIIIATDWNEAKKENKFFYLGDLVSIKGKISFYLEQIRISAYDICI